MVCATSPISLDLHKKWELGFTALTFNPSQGTQSLLNIKPPPICALTLHQHLQAIVARWESTPLTLDLPFLTLPLLPPLLVPSPFTSPWLYFLSRHPKSHKSHIQNLYQTYVMITVFIFLQIQQWEQNLERFNMDLFRMRCYLASLQGGELPNPKSLLAIASRPTKTTLGRLGIFSVSSFHALVRKQGWDR